MYILEIETSKWSRPSLFIPQRKPPSLQRTNCPSVRDIEKNFLNLFIKSTTQGKKIIDLIN